jgi:hypothetical protein
MAAVSMAGAEAQTAPAGIKMAQVSQPAATNVPVRVRRPLRRVPVYPRYEPEPDGVYPRYYPGRNAVRDCTATYVQEYRPSGTVIVPRMSCFWRPG